MADPDYKVESNVPGAYYVDDNCIDCDLCRSIATLNFDRDEDMYVSYVSKQPESEEERALCEQAIAACPVEAIGNDGAQEV